MMSILRGKRGGGGGGWENHMYVAGWMRQNRGKLFGHANSVVCAKGLMIPRETNHDATNKPTVAILLKDHYYPRLENHPPARIPRTTPYLEHAQPFKRTTAPDGADANGPLLLGNITQVSFLLLRCSTTWLWRCPVSQYSLF